jgi:3-dehydroquinate dehydratase
MDDQMLAESSLLAESFRSESAIAPALSVAICGLGCMVNLLTVNGGKGGCGL